MIAKSGHMLDSMWLYYVQEMRTCVARSHSLEQSIRASTLLIW